jgi:predicted PurR-regulated permease PerM
MLDSMVPTESDPSPPGDPGGQIPTPQGVPILGERPKGSVGERVERLAVRSDVPLATIVTTVLVVVATGLVLVLLWVLRQEFLYLVVGTFLALLMAPFVRFLERRGLSHGVSASFVFLGGIVIAGFVLYLFTAPLVGAVTHFAHELPTLAHKLEKGQGTL